MAAVLCGCGCGEPVNLAPRTETRYGWRKGQPQRFLNGHNNNLTRIDRRCPDCGGPRSEAKARRCLACDIAKRRAAGIAIFWSQVDQSGGPAACWPWTGFVAANGYGKASDGRDHHEYAHRLAYRLAVGPIPKGQELDHLCHTEDRSCPGGDTCRHRRCANPRHLESVEHIVNVRRGRWVVANRVVA